MNMYAVCVNLDIAPDRMDEFMPLMRQQADNSVGREPGCQRFDVLTDPARPNHVFLYELYDDRAAFEVHMQTDHFGSFDATVAPMVESKVVVTYDSVYVG